MSQKHPVIAITGSSGAGTTTVTTTFAQIFRREGINAAIVEGDSFHRYDRKEMRALIAEVERVAEIPRAIRALFSSGKPLNMETPA